MPGPDFTSYGTLLHLASGTDVFFDDTGQIRSHNDNHRILFRRPEDVLELREYGKIIFSPGATAGTETARVVFLADGRVGIGTSAPSEALSVSGPSEPFVRVTHTGMAGNPYLEFGMNAGNNAGLFQTASGKDLKFRAGGGENLIIAANGNVGIGTFGPQAKLHVAGDVKLNGPLAQIHGNTLVGLAANANNDLIHNLNGNVYWFKGAPSGGSQTGGTQLMRLTDQGALLLGTTPRVAIDSGGYALYG